MTQKLNRKWQKMQNKIVAFGEIMLRLTPAGNNLINDCKNFICYLANAFVCATIKKKRKGAAAWQNTACRLRKSLKNWRLR